MALVAAAVVAAAAIMAEMAYRSRRVCWLALEAVAIVARIIDWAAVECRNRQGSLARLAAAAAWELNSYPKIDRLCSH